jgi:hypothetical protein
MQARRPKAGGDALRSHAGAGDVPHEGPQLQSREAAHDVDGRARPATVGGEDGQPGDDADGTGTLPSRSVGLSTTAMRTPFAAGRPQPGDWRAKRW